jgi:hypothetical protein
MTRISLTAAIAMLASFGTAGTAGAAVVLSDTYIGGNDHGYGDVIGTSEYQITQATAARAGNLLTVTITTNYNAADAGLTNFGDLFLSSSWNPKGTAANGYKADNFDYVNGTHWQFAIKPAGLSGPTSTDVGGTAAIYLIDQASDVKLSYVNSPTPSRYVWRDGQPVQVSSTATLLAGQGASSWYFDSDPSGNNNKLSFTFDATGMGLLDGNGWDLAISWAMICANDVIQGDLSQVPEPGSLLLLLGGLAGLAGFRARRKQA